MSTGELLLLGVSHKTAPVSLRERLAMSDKEAQRFLAELVGTEDVHEAVAISTCNRLEIYTVVGDPVQAETDVLARLARRAHIRPTELADVMYSPRNCDAARQLYRVTSGLESMIVGETEVQGQVKRAYDAALSSGTTGPLTNRLFTAALQTGKRVRSETRLSEGSLSISSVAVDLAREIVGSLTNRTVVLIGAGETSERTAQALAEEGVSKIFVANRHVDRAHAMASRFGGVVVSLDELPARLAEADIVVASTWAPHAIVGVEELEVVMHARDGRPLVVIDIAVPRDVEPTCAELPGVTLYDIDDLQAVVARKLSVRKSEKTRAEAIVEDEIQRFARWLGQLDVMPTIAALREHGVALVDQVLAENQGRWESASAKDLERVDAIARAVMQRLLHEPTIRLKAFEDGGSHGRLQLIRELFDLPEGTPSGAAAPEEERSDNVLPLDERRRPA